MREDLNARLRRDKQFVIDLKIDREVSISDIEKMAFPVYAREKPQKRIGEMSIRQFLEKFG